MEATLTKTIPDSSRTPALPLFRWERITLLSILAYEGLGALAGGIMLLATPDGSSMSMPVEIMNGVFPDFAIPGTTLLVLGLLTCFAFFTLKAQKKNDWIYTSMAMGGLAIWFIVEIGILQELHWLHAMWGLPVLTGCAICIPLVQAKERLKADFLLNCGILSSILYAIITLIVPEFWPAYDNSSQTISELSAIGAPTRLLWILLSIPYSLLIGAFAWGIWKIAWNKNLKFAGALLLIYAATGFLWYLFPMHLRETLAMGGATFSDTGHLTLAAVTQVLFLATMGFCAAGLDKGFRIYSLITFLLLGIFGYLTFIGSPGVGKNEPTPLLGLWERINIGLFIIWIMVLPLRIRNQRANH